MSKLNAELADLEERRLAVAEGRCPVHGSPLNVERINTETGAVQVWCPDDAGCAWYNRQIETGDEMYELMLDRFLGTEGQEDAPPESPSKAAC